ncbi:MAG: aminoacyl-tRNA hydrolase [Candidatus Omnitrophota bacterium]
MKIIVGLGNPGLKYRNTKHNVGFKVVDLLAKKHRCGIRKKGFHGAYGTGRIAGQEVILFKPLTFINLSGEAVEAICASRLEDIKDLLVISDDINLSLGNIRLREKGSSGGHNGLQSIIERVGSNFARLRVGIEAGEIIEDAAAYVLSPFPRRVRSGLGDVLEKSAECAEAWLAKGVRAAMNNYNK